MIYILKRGLWLGVFSAAVLANPLLAYSQVQITAGLDETYDDNLFLESGDAVAPELEGQVGPDGEPLIDEKNDGRETSGFITHAYLSADAPISYSKYFSSGISGTVGGLVFDDFSDENRITVDGTLRLDAQEGLISRPYYMALYDTIRSGSNDVSVAEGSATQQTETNEAVFTLGFAPVNVAKKTDLNGGYTFLRHDFLGALTSDSDTDESDEGSNFISNALDANLSHHISDRTTGSLNGRTAVLTYDGVENNDISDKDADNLDHIEADANTGLSYIASERLTMNGSVGINYSHFLDDQEERTSTIINPDGSTSTISTTPDDDITSLAYSGSISYLPNALTTLIASASQSRGIDIDGDITGIRTVALNASRAISNKLALSIGGRYIQFADGDNFSEASERYEATIAGSYLVAASTSLAIGYNYAQQNEGSGDDNQFFFQSGDYDSNRVFISLTMGLVGTKS